jgi:hypothetical protein
MGFSCFTLIAPTITLKPLDGIGLLESKIETLRDPGNKHKVIITVKRVGGYGETG